jgi:hypothetical protein
VRLPLAKECEPPFWEALGGVNGGWSFALNFCFFLFKQKEKRKMLLDTFAKVSEK